MASNNSWHKIFHDIGGDTHNFSLNPLYVSAKEIKKSCQAFEKTSEKEVRILCKQDTRESRPEIFKQNGLFYYQ